jgi:hypothetical protein
MQLLPEGGDESSPGWTLSKAKGEPGDPYPIIF